MAYTVELLYYYQPIVKILISVVLHGPTIACIGDPPTLSYWLSLLGLLPPLVVIALPTPSPVLPCHLLNTSAGAAITKDTDRRFKQ